MIQPRLHIEVIGQGDPLVLLHGWGWHSGIWQPLLASLSKKHQLFLVDLPGFGQSPLITQDYCLADIVPLLISQTPPQATWLGWSMGGLFAYWAAIHFSDHVKQLITVTASPRPLRAAEWPGLAPDTLKHFSELLIQQPQQTLLDFLELQLRGSPKRLELFSQLKNVFSSTQPEFLTALLGGLKLLQTTDLRDELKKIHCPNLHIFGERDTIFPAALANKLPALIPHSHVVTFKQTGHLPFLTHPEEFLKLVEDFTH